MMNRKPVNSVFVAILFVCYIETECEHVYN